MKGMDEVSEISRFREQEWHKPWIMEAKIREKLDSKSLPLVKELGRTPLQTEFGDCTYIVFGDYTNGHEYDVLIFGKFDAKNNDYKNPLLRIHSSCRSSELFHSTFCECRQELEKAMKLMQKEKKGVVLYLHQEGVGNGVASKLSAYREIFAWEKTKETKNPYKIKNNKKSLYQVYKKLGFITENRNFSAAVQILKSLNIKSARLLTNNPEKVSQLEKLGIKVEQKGIHIKPKNKAMAKLLKYKATELGHKINKNHWKR